MGLAICWVFFFHSDVSFPNHIIFYPIKFVKCIGYGAVDIFIFLSGFGLMHGMIKKQWPYVTFYKRRFFRIYPAYFIIVTISLIVDSYLDEAINLSDVFLKLSTLWFWAGNGRFLWYIPCIFALYIIFPVFFRHHQSSSNKTSFTLIIILTAYILCIISIACNKSYYLIFLTRLPVFILGAHLGYKSINNTEQIDNHAVAGNMLCLIASLVSIAIIKLKIPKEIQELTGAVWYPFIFIVYPLTLFTSNFLKYLDESQENNNISTINNIIFWAGTYSLEIYLVHEHIVFPIGEHFLKIYSSKFEILNAMNKGNIPEYLIFFIISMGLAFPINKIANIRLSTRQRHSR